MVIHIDMVAADGAAAGLESCFLNEFGPAIAAQGGFVSAELLRPDQGDDYRLAIRFENEALRQKWVATDLHEKVWSALKSFISCHAVAKFVTIETAHG